MTDLQRPTAPSHPYVGTLTLDPADFPAFCVWLEDAPQHKMLDCDQSEPDVWPVRVASASAEAASRLHDRW